MPHRKTFGYQQIDDAIAQNARPLIVALEQKIQKEFGLTVMIGMEKECFFETKKYRFGSDHNVADTIENYRQKKFIRAKRIDDAHPRKDKKQDKSLPIVQENQASVVHKFEKEAWDHKFEFQTTPTTPLRAIIRMDGQCQLLEHKINNARYLRNQFRKKAQADVKAVDFDAYHQENTSVGLHVNFSLWDKKGHNLMGDSLFEQPALELTQHALWQYINTDQQLIIADDSARIRAMESKYFNEKDKFYKYQGLSDNVRGHLQFCAPAANTRHDLAVLMVMAGIYRGLRAAKTGKTIEPTENVIIQPNQDAALAHFKKHGMLIDDVAAITGDKEHVRALKKAVIEAVQNDVLCQPTLAALGQAASMAAGR